MLYNFDVNDAEPKKEHKDFLRDKALPVLRAGGGVTVIGLTDRTGSGSHDKALSDQRVARTIDFLRK